MTKGYSDPTPVTTHRGYAIRYGVNSDRWSCDDLNLEADKLSTLKGQIDRAVRAYNEGGVEVISIGRGDTGKVTKIVATRIVREQVYKPAKSGYDYETVRKVDHYGESRGDRKTLHRNRPMTEFAPDNQTTREMLAEHQRLEAAAQQARKKADDYLASIPRITDADIAILIPPEPGE